MIHNHTLSEIYGRVLLTIIKSIILALSLVKVHLQKLFLVSWNFINNSLNPQLSVSCRSEIDFKYYFNLIRILLAYLKWMFLMVKSSGRILLKQIIFFWIVWKYNKYVSFLGRIQSLLYQHVLVKATISLYIQSVNLILPSPFSYLIFDGKFNFYFILGYLRQEHWFHRKRCTLTEPVLSR